MELSQILDSIELAREKASIHDSVALVGVSKNVTQIEVKRLYEQGLRSFGENRVQELLKKRLELSGFDISWNFIGRLQKNKINHLINSKPVLWQSCDSLEMAFEVNKRLDYTLNTLLQINSANETSKQGVLPEHALEIYHNIKSKCKNLNMLGVMSIGANSDDLRSVAKSFESTYKIFATLGDDAQICSMGMSGDFELAIQCGSNMIRLGSILFEA